MDKRKYSQILAQLAESASGGLTIGSAVSASGGLGSQISQAQPNRLGLCFWGGIMPYWAYILQNQETGKLYKGQTSDLESRLKRHNSNEAGSMRYIYKQIGS